MIKFRKVIMTLLAVALLGIVPVQAQQKSKFPDVKKQLSLPNLLTQAGEEQPKLRGYYNQCFLFQKYSSKKSAAFISV